MDWIEHDGVKLAYEFRGTGKPVVLLAGFSADHSYWAAVGDQLVEHRQVLAIDNRGVGESGDPPGPYSAATMARDVVAVCDHLGLEEFDLVGQSMGVSISIELAANFPSRVDRLGLLNGYVKIRPAFCAVVDYALQILRAGGSRREFAQILLPWCLSDASFAQPDVLEKMLADADSNPSPPSLGALEAHARILREFDAGALLGKIQAPTLSLGTRQDVLALPAGAQELARGIQGAELHLMDGAHDIAAEDPESILPILQDFLGRSPRRTERPGGH